MTDRGARTIGRQPIRAWCLIIEHHRTSDIEHRRTDVCRDCASLGSSLRLVVLTDIQIDGCLGCDGR